MTSEKKTDRRVLYTKRILREALLELMSEKPVSKITPTELCRRADINRNTFYSHYDTPLALLRSIEDELFEQVRVSLEQSHDMSSVRSFLTDICQTIYVNRDLCMTLFSDYGDKDFLSRIACLAREKCAADWAALGIDTSDERFELLFAYTVSGSVAVIEKWTRDGMKESVREIAAFIEKVTYSGPRAVL